MSEGLENINAPTHNYSIEDFIKMMNLMHLIPEVKNNEAYPNFILQVEHVGNMA